jgi:hypothetical protein
MGRRSGGPPAGSGGAAVIGRRPDRDTGRVFILYAIPIGILIGYLVGGRLDRLAAVRFRLGLVAMIALAVQLVLFSALADGLPVEFVRAAYVLSTALVLAVVVANIRLAGVPLIVVGALSNLAAIVANGGAMPASPGALAALGLGVGGHTSSIAVERPALEPLTDVFAMPAWMPMANIFSVGDVLIGLGVVVAIAGAMRGRATDREEAVTERPDLPD